MAGNTQRKPDQAFTLDFWVDHIVGVMDALEVEKAHFVGNSFGGALTLAIATEIPLKTYPVSVVNGKVQIEV